MSKGTPHRPIRMSDELWTKAQAKAAQLGTTASEKARELLAAWVDEDDEIRVYETDLGDFVVADRAGWLPGVFPTRSAAEEAARAVNPR